jgi:hypothetical protein
MRFRSTTLALTLLASVSGLALAHDKGTIRLASKELSVGAELSLRGEKLPKNATLRLQLRGTLETFPLAEVRTNAAGAFQARLALPQEAQTGSYTVAVMAADGDVVAQAALAIVEAAAAAGAVAEPGHPAEHAMPNTAPGATEVPHASAEMMQVDVTTTVGEWLAMIAIILVSVGGGAALLVGALRTKA